MNATISQQTTWDLTVDGKVYTGLRKVSEWNGLWELRGDGVTIIVSAPPTPGPGDLFAQMFSGQGVSLQQDVSVISASPCVLAQCVKY